MNRSQSQVTGLEQRGWPKGKIPLEPGSIVAVVGGGPAGAFFAMQFLRRAAELARNIRVVVFERHHQACVNAAAHPDCWKDCNRCAGGISPRLVEVLRSLGLDLPEAIIQRRIRSLTIQGDWKNIQLDVPAGREMFSTFADRARVGAVIRSKTWTAFFCRQRDGLAPSWSVVRWSGPTTRRTAGLWSPTA